MGDVGVLGAEGLLADGEGALVERLGLGVAAVCLVEHGQVVERVGDVGVLGAEGLLAGWRGRAGRAARPRPKPRELVVESYLIQDHSAASRPAPSRSAASAAASACGRSTADRGPVGYAPRSGAAAPRAPARTAASARALAVASSSPSRVTAWTRRWTVSAVGLDAEQREAAERLDRAVAVERVAQALRQRLGLAPSRSRGMASGARKASSSSSAARAPGSRCGGVVERGLPGLRPPRAGSRRPAAATPAPWAEPRPAAAGRPAMLTLRARMNARACARARGRRPSSWASSAGRLALGGSARRLPRAAGHGLGLGQHVELERRGRALPILPARGDQDVAAAGPRQVGVERSRARRRCRTPAASGRRAPACRGPRRSAPPGRAPRVEAERRRKAGVVGGERGRLLGAQPADQVVVTEMRVGVGEGELGLADRRPAR